MSSRNDRAWASYDNWLLQGSGVDDVEVEVFETEKYKLFSANEDDVRKFDDEMSLHEKKDYCKESYENFEEYIQECKENLQDELNLSKDIADAEYEYWEDWNAKREDYLEQKADWQRERRNLKEE